MKLKYGLGSLISVLVVAFVGGSIGELHRDSPDRRRVSPWHGVGWEPPLDSSAAGRRSNRVRLMATE